jgi:regulator of sigma E protease
MAAKFFKVRVDEFNIGFPPRLFSFKKGETLYSINLIPLGGYVKIKGETGEYEEDPDSFMYKPIWQRCIILASGVLMNFITAIFFLSIGLMIGLPASADNQEEFGRFAKISNSYIQIVSVVKDSPAQKAGLGMGDIIVSVDNKKINKIKDIQNYIENSDKAIDIKIRRGNETINKKIEPKKLEVSSKQQEDKKEISKKAIGVALSKGATVSYPFYIAPYYGIKNAFSITGKIFVSLYSLIKMYFSNQVSKLPIAGPVGIAVITGKMSKLGIAYLLQFIALLSINLAIINILPFPALDGAHILFLIIEKIRGKALSNYLKNWIHTVGFACLMLLMIVVTFKDLARFGGKAFDFLGNIF